MHWKNFMATEKPRITITLEPHIYELLQRFSRLDGKPMSGIVVELLDIASPAIERLYETMVRCRKELREAGAGIAEAVGKFGASRLPAAVPVVSPPPPVVSPAPVVSVPGSGKVGATVQGAAPPVPVKKGVGLGKRSQRKKR